MADNPLSSAVQGAAQAVQNAANSPAGQAAIASAKQAVDAALDSATQSTIQAICAQHGLPYETVAHALQAVASHFGITNAHSLFAALRQFAAHNATAK